MGNPDTHNPGSQDKRWVGPVVGLAALALAVGVVAKSCDSSDFSGAGITSAEEGLSEPQAETRARARGFFRQLLGPEEDTGAEEEPPTENAVHLVDEEGHPKNVHMALQDCIQREEDVALVYNTDPRGEEFFSLRNKTPSILITPPNSVKAWWMPLEEDGDDVWTVSMGDDLTMEYEVPSSWKIANYKSLGKTERGNAESALSTICEDVRSLSNHEPPREELCKNKTDTECTAYINALEHRGSIGIAMQEAAISFQESLDQQGIESDFKNPLTLVVPIGGNSDVEVRPIWAFSSSSDTPYLIEEMHLAGFTIDGNSSLRGDNLDAIAIRLKKIIADKE
ncbi:MAG: hypothetical protein WC882_00925 [Candidatus Gracilibacteria bacterium]